MQLSVIILNYNVRYFLELCVLSVQKAIQNLDAEIIVVDNNSSDDSCAMMKAKFPQIKLIENKENLGFPKGNNIAVEQAKGKYICILNPDTIVSEDTFHKIFNSNLLIQKTGIIGCKLIDGSGKFLPESKRGIPTPWVAFTKVFGMYKWFPYNTLFNKYYAQHLDKNQSGEIEILVGAFMFLERNLYNEVGGFDEKCFMYADDIDLSYMVLQKKKINYYFHDTTVVHFKGESTVRDEKYIKRFQEAMNYFYAKHFKKSFFFTFFMKTGSILFSFLKKSQAKKPAKSNPENYVLISDNITLKDKLSDKLQKNIQISPLENGKVVFSQSISKNSKTEIIFDVNYCNFKESLSFMEEKSKMFTFKFLVPESGYLLGSNSSNDRGEIIFV
ncbi:glycosyltransferase family 2 protein [Flavobacterium capsici]|uniref:Glycosyltransferase family 2 protein n=1 Tax=Flavobacterium capsici TaxID=3075618 RepID=A0AA96J8Z6_9FLAO|nr:MULTISPECIES: glycosyltransferase family 2 protein [unclassified Flavobacterium]WNM18931.1 glycosyltransferase family 2 protein [Flavobacterium sp. PMR2A8]WNM22981.1 glycosyltransferase family 2 protein [Flavobacterium sp. PMTSA4]